MNFQANLWCHTSFWNGYDGLRPIQRSADRRDAFFQRLSIRFYAGLTVPVAKSSNSQPFWGNVVANNGAGPLPIPHKSMSSQILANAITFCLSSDAQQADRIIADQMSREHRVDMAVKPFHRHVGTYSEHKT